MTAKLVLALILVSTSYLYCIVTGIDDIPSHYISSEPIKSLFCNVCGVLSSIVNDTLHDGSADFESLVGFRLDSNGKKIRKQSGWLKLFLSLEDVCDSWKDKYRTAKRKNGYLYLIENEAVRAMQQIERKRKEKLEKEASDRLNKKWDKEWEIEKVEKDRIYNLTHDEYGNLIETNDTKNVNDTDYTNDDKEEEDKDKDKDKEDTEKEDKDKEESVSARYFYEKKPKLVKRKTKNDKIIGEICYFLNEKYDEWLHEQQRIIPKKMKEGEKIEDYLDSLSFCLEDKICKKEMFDIKPKIYKFKKELNIPAKPKRAWTPPIKYIQEEYEEEMEDDVDDNTNNTDNTDNIDAANNDENNNENNNEIDDVNNNDNDDQEPKSEL